MKRSSRVWAGWFFVLPLLLPSPSHADCHPRTIRYTVHPGVPTPLYLSVPGGAVCRLHSEHHDGHHDEIGLVADADGNLRFTVEPPADESRELELVLRCDDFRQRIQLRAADRATQAAPFPPADDPALRQVPVTVLPALTGDPAAYTDAELAAAGYPVRPDATRNPSAYAVWLSAVTRPIKVIAPQTVSLPGLQHTTFTKNSGNWSGFELIPLQPDPSASTTPAYVEVSGHWIVPQVSGELTRSSHSSLWVGLDGDGQFGASDLVQAGTEQAALPVLLTPPPPLQFGHPPQRWGVTTSYAWTEVLPIQPVESVIANFPVQPGDGILTIVWVGGSGSNLPDSEATLANFQIYNSSTQMMTTVQTTIETFEENIHFRGATAEWVMERPGVVQNNQLVGFFDLADYHSQCIAPTAADYATMYIDATFARAQTAQHQYTDFDFLTQSNYDNSMVNGSHLLSAAYASPDAQSICFGWFGFD
jgi:hypothetical protein